MKKLITIFMCLVLCLSMFAACNKEQGGEEQQPGDVVSDLNYICGEGEALNVGI